MSMMQKRGGVVIQSVARALDILHCFELESELGISEISRAMGLSKSTIYGLVNTLTTYGYLEQTSKTSKYKLGLKLFELGNVVQQRMDIRQEARPCCQLLSDKYRTTVHLATHSEGDLIYVDKVTASSGSFVLYSQVGKRAPMYCTGVGKALLAHVSDSYLEEYIFSRPMVKITENTIDTREKLLKELAEVRELGYAKDNEEIELGLRCIAAPIFDSHHQPTFALSMSFHYGRLWDVDWNEAARDVQYYARQISERLGHISK